MNRSKEDTIPRLIDRPLPELRRSVREGSIIPDAPLIEAIRGEAARFYHTDAETARRIARRACDLAQLGDDLLAHGWGHRAMAEALLFSGKMLESEAAYAKAASAWREANAAGLLGQLLVGRTHLLAILGRYDDSQAAAEEARCNLEAVGDDAYLAKLAMNLGTVALQHDQYGLALKEYDRAMLLFARLRVRDEAVLGLEINRGIALSQLDRDEEALDLFTRLDVECAKGGYELLRAQTRMNAAYVHSQRADFARALNDLRGATDYFRKTDHPSFLAECYLNRAEIYQQLNLHDEAIELTGLAIPLFEQEGMTYDRGLAISQEALSRLAVGNTDVAIRTIRQGRKLFLREKNRSRVAWVGLLWAEALSRKDRIPIEAEKRTLEAIDAFRELGLVRWEAAAVILLNRLQADRLPPLKRIPRLRSLLRRVPEAIYPIPAYRLLEALGDAQQLAGRRTAAMKTYERALNRLEDLRIRIPTEDSKIAFLQDKTHLYDRLIAMELERRKPSLERLFGWMERSRAQALYDRLRDPSSYLESETEDSIARGKTSERDASLVDQRRRLAWLHTRLSRLELGTQADRLHAKKLRAELARAEEGWAKALRERDEGRAAVGSGLVDRRLTSPSQIEEKLPKGWGFVSYHIGAQFALAVAITKEGAAWRRLAPDLKSRVIDLTDRLDFQWGAAAMAGVQKRMRAGADDRDRALRRATDSILAELFDLIWRPIEEIGFSGVERWIVAPHGAIHRVPIPALRNEEGYFIERFDCLTTPSGRIWLELPMAEAARFRSAWIGGVPSPQLPAVQEEVDCILRHLRGWKIKSTLEPTRTALKKDAQDSALIHLAVHGHLRQDNPAYSYLQLIDGPLFVHDLAGLRLPASTVVLSACSSGRGAAPVGDEWIGLARGFLRAGASSVVASLWPVHEEPTLGLMDRFYSHLASGESPPLAIGAAMREQVPKWSHPWEWASFGVLGGV